MSFAIVVIINKAFKLLELVLVVYCDFLLPLVIPRGLCRPEKRDLPCINAQRPSLDFTYDPNSTITSIEFGS